MAQPDPGNGADSRTVPMYEALAQDIKALGIETVFGLMSDDTAAFAVTLDAIGIEFYGARHENIAITMADGYASATGRLGVAVIGRGPAMANGLHGAVFANRSGAPVLIIYGDAAQPTGAVNPIGPDYKALDAQAVLTAAGIRAFTVTSAESARATLVDAATAARRGTAAALLLPVNVQHQPVRRPADLPPPVLADDRPAPAPARAQSLEAAAAILERARRPLIIAGNGVRLGGGRAAVIALAERIGALVATTARGKDMFAGHPWNLGIVGSFSHSAGRRMIDQADCVLVFGAGLNFLTMSFGNALPAVPVIQVDAVRDHIGRWTPVDLAVVGDARLVAEQLAERLPARAATDRPFHSAEVLDFLTGFDIAQDYQPAETARTIDPRTLAVALDRMLPQDRNLVCDAGNFLGVVPFIRVPGPDRFKMTNDFASIGLGFGAALGFARGRPDSPTVMIIGDGGFMMTMGELETVVREDLPIVIVLMNDCAYGAELHHLRLRQLPVAKSVFPDVDFAPVAEAFGFQTATIRTPADLAACADMLARPEGPILLDCKINADVAAPFMSEVAEYEARAH